MVDTRDSYDLDFVRNEVADHLKDSFGWRYCYGRVHSHAVVLGVEMKLSLHFCNSHGWMNFVAKCYAVNGR